VWHAYGMRCEGRITATGTSKSARSYLKQDAEMKQDLEGKIALVPDFYSAEDINSLKAEHESQGEDEALLTQRAKPSKIFRTNKSWRRCNQL